MFRLRITWVFRSPAIWACL